MNLDIIKTLDSSRFSVVWNMSFSAANSQALTRQYKTMGFSKRRKKQPTSLKIYSQMPTKLVHKSSYSSAGECKS